LFLFNITDSVPKHRSTSSQGTARLPQQVMSAAKLHGLQSPCATPAIDACQLQAMNRAIFD
jgi:hypothetical protein